MAKPGEIDVAHVARLARLDLTEAEASLFQEQLGRVLEYAEQLKKADTSGIENDDRAAVDDPALREDEPRDWLSADEALSNAPRMANDLFVVPKVVE